MFRARDTYIIHKQFLYQPYVKMGFFQAVASRLKEKKSGHAMKRYLGYSLQQSRKFESNIVHAINFVLFELFFTAYLELYLDRKCKNQKSQQTNKFANGKTIYLSLDDQICRFLIPDCYQQCMQRPDKNSLPETSGLNSKLRPVNFVPCISGFCNTT